MVSISKEFIIGVLIYLGISVLIFFSNGLGFDIEVTFYNNQIKWIIISIIRFILSLIRNNKDKNTVIFKKILIIIEIYLILLIIIVSEINLTPREFFFFYLASIGLVYEALHKRVKKWQTIFFSTIYSFIMVLIGSIGCLMRYREPINEQQIINNKSYNIYFNIDNNIYTSIIINGENVTKKIRNNPKSIEIKKNGEYNIIYSSQERNNDNWIIIQDQEGNILKATPQTSFNFSSNNQKINYIINQGQIKFYELNENFPEELNQFKTNYLESKKRTILSVFPYILQINGNFQKISLEYTKILGSIFPFFYKKNVDISKQYIQYFDIPQKKNYENIDGKNGLLKNFGEEGLKKTNLREKYKKYIYINFNKLFNFLLTFKKNKDMKIFYSFNKLLIF